MTNRYQGTCTNCHGTVAAGTGTCTRTASGWAIQHTNCSTQLATAGQTGWSNASIRRGGGSVYAARVGSTGACRDCGNHSSQLVRGLCLDCRDYC